jgi:hypothetical protein
MLTSPCQGGDRAAPRCRGWHLPFSCWPRRAGCDVTLQRKPWGPVSLNPGATRLYSGFLRIGCRGEVAEWSKAHAWNACRRATVSRVRIPPSPPSAPRRGSPVSLCGVEVGLLCMSPDPECGVIGNLPEIVVGRKHRQIMTYAQLSQESINRSDLHAVSAAAVPQLRRPDVIVAIWHQQGDGRKSVENLVAGLRTQEALKKFLKDEACRQNHLAGFDCLDERPDLPGRRDCIAAKREGPNASVHEKTQSRVRSPL